MNTLVIDIGGTNVKLWRTGETDKIKFPSGKDLGPERLVDEVLRLARDWTFHRVSIGYPGAVRTGVPAAEPYVLAPGWVGFPFADRFGCPVRTMNDACMQALGSYDGGRMLYLGFGTNLGATLIADDAIVPLAIGHLAFRTSTFNDWLSRAGRRRHGTRGWERAIYDAAPTLRDAFLVDYVVLGGGNAKKIVALPPHCRRGGNHNAYFGGLRMWEDGRSHERSLPRLAAIPSDAPSLATG